ncbi:MAG: phosphatase PAP2 family protein [Planctomycetes bacterium]|nr:phosphatase PAP2 family protein [Planctomycetota bacterium]MDA0947406.1 phosphatase PAP2 family protein [Planctomycetota bacterium]
MTPPRPGLRVRVGASLDALPERGERLLLVGLLAALLGLYVPINHLTAARSAAAPASWVDARIPLTLEWMGLYGLLYVFLLLPAALPMDRASFRAVARAYAATTLVSFAVFLAAPVHMVERPVLAEPDSFFAWLLALTHWIDTPSNCLPSLHVSLSLLAGLSAGSAAPRLGRLAVPLGLLIGTSTLFVEQHWWADVWTGWLLGLVTWALLVRGQLRPVPAGSAWLRRGLLGLVALQGLLAAGAWLLYASGRVQPASLPDLTGWVRVLTGAGGEG